MSLPYMPLFVDDYEADTAHLTLIEDGVYSRLLRLCWRSPKCRVPNDMDWIARKIRIGNEAERDALETVISEFFTVKRGYVFSKRLSEEYERIRVTIQKRKEAGKSGGRAKSLKTNKTGSSKAKALLKHPEPDPEPYPDKDTNVSFSGAQGRAKKGSGFVKPRNAADAAMAYIQRKGLFDEQAGTGADGESIGDDVSLVPRLVNHGC